jgi:hypothetical protein
MHQERNRAREPRLQKVKHDLEYGLKSWVMERSNGDTGDVSYPCPAIIVPS